MDRAFLLFGIPVTKDPSFPQIARWVGYIVAACAFLLGCVTAGWNAKDYVDSIKQETRANTEGIQLLREHGWSRLEMERWGYELEKGNRSVLNASGVPGGLYVPPMPAKTDLAVQNGGGKAPPLNFMPYAGPVP